jgi:hypothetical protein
MTSKGHDERPGQGQHAVTPSPRSPEPSRGDRADDPNPDELRAQWAATLEANRQDLLALHLRAEVIGALDDEIVRTQRPGGRDLLEWVIRPMYAEGQVLRVRRLVDDDPRTDSLYRLLTSMADHPEMLSRESYGRLYIEGGGSPELVDHDFDLLAGGGEPYPARDVLLAWRKALSAAGHQVKRYVDQRVAHRDKAPSSSAPTWEELRAAIRQLSELAERIGRVLLGVHTLSEPFVDPGWRSVFAPGLFIREPRGDP